MSDTERDRGLLSLIDRLVKRPGASAAVKPFAPRQINPDKAVDAEGQRDGLDPVLPDDKPLATLEPELVIESTREVTRNELADLIIKALQAGDKYPTKGFEITVYGAHPWNAMLRVTPAAGAVNAEAWRARLQTVVLLFRDRYEIREEEADA